MVNPELKKKQEEIILEAKSFFDAHKKEIGESIRGGENVVKLSFEKLAAFSPEISEKVLQAPEEAIALLELALEETNLVKKPRIRLTELPPTTIIRIRNVRAKHLDQLIEVEGIVKQASDVRPQVVNAKFECPNCGAILSVLQIDRKFHEPSRCTCAWKGTFKPISKEMVDVQRLLIEESPDMLEGGEQPRRISVLLKEDLVDPKMEERTTPGSKVKICGVLKEVPIPLQTGAISTRFDIMLEANNIISLEESFEDLNITEEEVKEILELAADPKLFKRLSSSISPSVYGYDHIKEAILLQLFGGVKKKKSDGGMTRGDIHMLLVGDPGVAKSVLLRFAAGISKRGRYVSGKAATAAGLTAAVVKDEFLKGWSLEAGAMVLSNKGMVCIDEIEKMNETDRSTMHEAMEQQCYQKDLELLFSDGSRARIGEFVDKMFLKNPQRVKQETNYETLPLDEEIKVLTTDFESIYPTKISQLSRHIAPKELMKVILNNGKELVVTPEHPCWAMVDGKLTTMPAKELKVGEFFPIPAELPIEGKEQEFTLPPYKNGPQLCKMLGYHISDGCYELNRGKKNGIQFSNKDLKLIEDYSNSIKEIFNITPGITRRGDVMSARVISKEVVSFLTELDKNLLEKGSIKAIPDQIMKCKKEDLALLLRAIFDGDGTVVNVKRNGCRATIVAENIKLANQLTELLLRFGIISSIYKDENIFRVDICGEENLARFYEQIGFVSDKKMNRLREYLAKTKTRRSITEIIPNVTNKIHEIFKTLGINTEKELGSQIHLECNKHKKFLQKMITIAEKKAEKLLLSKEKLNNLLPLNELVKIRGELEIPQAQIAKSLNKSYYQLSLLESKKEFSREYQERLIEKITQKLSILNELSILKKLAFGKIRWSKIKKVERVENKEDKWVYDLTVNDTHAFISNNLVLHNCVTISKANIHATLRAETTVLAAGNPKMGRFDPTTPIPQQIDISPALLSRFDVIFIIRDLPNRIQDTAIATHVLQEHKQETIRDVIDPKLLRKYIAYAKQKIKPKLTDEAVEEIKDFYIKLRNQSTKSDGDIQPIPITARQLEGIIRLSEAHAKMRLSSQVTKEDAQKAIDITKAYLRQVGYDEDTKTFDIDKITTGMTSSKRGKVVLVKEVLSQLESKMGKLIPLQELEKGIGDKLTVDELEEALNQLNKSGELFRPKKGYIQRT